MARSASRESRTRGSSSTSRTVALGAHVRHPGDRQADGEDRAPLRRAGLGRDLAAVLLEDLVADARPEAGAFADGLGREERVEDAAQDVGRDAGAGVGDADDRDAVLHAGLDRDLARARRWPGRHWRAGSGTPGRSASGHSRRTAGRHSFRSTVTRSFSRWLSRVRLDSISSCRSTGCHTSSSVRANTRRSRTILRVRSAPSLMPWVMESRYFSA